MATLLALSGSPSRTSRTALLAEHTTAGLRARGHRTHVLALRDLPAAPLLTADTHDASLTRAVSLVAEADALVVATPIHKAAYSGLLKTFLDLLPQHAFAGRPVLPWPSAAARRTSWPSTTPCARSSPRSAPRSVRAGSSWTGTSRPPRTAR